MRFIKRENGIYIHVPFCRSKCDYCSFYSLPSGEIGVDERYVRRVIEEIDFITSGKKPAVADTLYFGGGTPSLLEPDQVKRIIDHLSARFVLTANPEITLEMNPDDLDIDKLSAFKRAGINRIVLGVQTFNEGFRNCIGRRGRKVTDSDLELFFNDKEIIHCVDIIAGLPGQQMPDLIDDLQRLIRFMPEHISMYLLSVEHDTPLGARFTPDEQFDELQAELWSEAIDYLVSNGYIHYEISNYALPGFESRHNSKYWDLTPYYGFGPGAHSFVGGRRYSNVMTADEYTGDGEFIYSLDDDSPKNRAVEFLMTALRRMNGFSRDEFAGATGSDLDSSVLSELELLRSEGLIELSEGRYSLTRKGLLIADMVIYRVTDRLI